MWSVQTASNVSDKTESEMEALIIDGVGQIWKLLETHDAFK